MKKLIKMIISVVMVTVLTVTASGSGLQSVCRQDQFSKESPALLQKATAYASTIDTSYKNNEVGRAIKLGYVPDKLQSNYSKSITSKEFQELVAYALFNDDKSLNKKWLALTSKAGSGKVCRFEGAMFLFQAAHLLKVDKANACADIPESLEKEIYAWSGKSIFKNPTTSMFTFDFEEKEAGDAFKQSLLWASVYYVTSRVSLYSHNLVMELNSKLSFRGTATMTREEAILGALRLKESILPKGVYVEPEAVGASTIDSKTIENAKKMPVVTQTSLPSNWKGSCIANKSASNRWDFAHTSREFYESDIRYLSENGFNF